MLAGMFSSSFTRSMARDRRPQRRARGEIERDRHDRKLPLVIDGDRDGRFVRLR